MDHTEARTPILNVHWSWRFNCHPFNTDKHSAPESIFDTENWLPWNGDVDNPNDSEHDGTAEDHSYIEHNHAIEDL